jgi:two-component system nitrogen regulation sensor histidine kinase NtrY
MKLRTKYIVFVAILHTAALVLSWLIFNQSRIYFLIAEGVIIFSIIIAWNLYRELLLPLRSMMQGIDAIKDRDFNVKFVSTGKHEVDQLIGVYNEMIDQLRTERTKQQEQHFFLEKLIQTSPTGIIILDHDHCVQQINPKAVGIMQADPRAILQQPVTDLPAEFADAIGALRSGQTKLIKLKDATTYKIQCAHFIDRGFARNFIMIEELTAEILAAEKNVYGKVIRMMAHEVNNTIGPVNSIIQTALKADKLWDDHQHDLLKDAMRIALDRNHNLNLFMRNFADLVKLPPPNKRVVDLNLTVKNVVQLMQLQAHEKEVELNVTVPESPVSIGADEQQLEQALINIVKNALEAADKGGRIDVAVDQTKRALSITDDGKGIDSQQSMQLFTPFYTTKKDGQGIGLTLVREILVNHGFEFSLKTVAERKTIFQINF